MNLSTIRKKQFWFASLAFAAGFKRVGRSYFTRGMRIATAGGEAKVVSLSEPTYRPRSENRGRPATVVVAGREALHVRWR